MSSTGCNRRIRARAAALTVLGSAAALGGCGGAGQGGAGSGSGEDAPPRGLASGMDDSADQEPTSPEPAAEQVSVSGTRGRLDAQQIQGGVAPHAAALGECYKAELKQKKFLSGKLVLDVRVNKSGGVGRARIADSDVGDWAVERCVLGVARRMTFARPVGGDGEAEFQVPLDFTSDQPPLESWPEEQVAVAVAGKRAQLDACAGQAGGAPAGLIVTLYVGNRGQVKSVGFASAGGAGIADAWAECAARAVTTWTMADPMGKVVKASFRYSPGK